LRPEERALFDVYLMMLDDASLGSEVTTVIKTGQWAQGALRQVVTDHVNRFELMDDAYLRERASDVRTSVAACSPTCRKSVQQTWSTPTTPSWSAKN
jgi:signal transduction protein with GAF and PtsI domain